MNAVRRLLPPSTWIFRRFRAAPWLTATGWIAAASLLLATGGVSLATSSSAAQDGRTALAGVEAPAIQLAARLGGDDVPWGPFGPPQDAPQAPIEPKPDRGPEIIPQQAPPASGPGTFGTDLSDEDLPAAPGEVSIDTLARPEPTRIQVALLLPLSGASAGLGQAILNAAQLALFDAARNDFALLPRDTMGTPEGAELAARSAIDAGAALILGPMYAESVLRVAPIGRAAGVNIIAFSTDRSVAGDGVYIMGFLPRTQIQRVVAFARQKGLLRFAALAPATAYGHTVVREIQTAVREQDAMLTRVEFYEPGGGDATEVVQRLVDYGPRRQRIEARRRSLQGRTDASARAELKILERQALEELGFDAVVLPDGGERLLSVAPLLPYYDVDPARIRLLGTGQWDDPGLGREPALIGGWFAAPEPRLRMGFIERYRQVYGDPPPPRLATLGYDATALAAILAQGPNGPEFSAAALTAPNGFAGLDGIFRFRPDGLVERGLAVLEVQRDRPSLVSPAPQSFTPVTN